MKTVIMRNNFETTSYRIKICNGVVGIAIAIVVNSHVSRNSYNILIIITTTFL